ncbi:MAG: Dph6-related ATP pyrophosphatase [Candidatus Kariarchaeaceae archaeon]|jgi:ABC transporter with metal-binding/Fe-S-binding domain ATP-binding protein
MRVVCLVSGGKDSILALWLASHQFDVVEILTIRSNCTDSLLYHLPNNKYVSFIAEMLGIPHRDIWVNSCNLDDEINTLKDALIESRTKAVITGGIRSDFQRSKFNRAAILANMKCFNPLWRISSNKLMSELINNKFRIIFSSVAGMGLGKNLLGEEITQEILASIIKAVPDLDISITGEGGEYESFVFDAPFFPSKINIKKFKLHWNEYREEGFYEIKEIQLSEK